ncbi:hypothetical protein LEMA_P087850.1 [Plenodomus lingam JN3]|uniref:C6 transcription factor n=1 Tax=Leptosphaeria maculans (strain JN3 / isolate v23.1.3 / race Av1-4-5-6-7-8) TaxID=985895 RepID=E5A7F1_LEPMJ|nr:hypothetical protein LEMA_P087850.1 [Plenodomus lingam JN3]CBX99546.1 hypothetical protein LEMA_P087850.1 [Plenodomus lingam JN3]
MAVTTPTLAPTPPTTNKSTNPQRPGSSTDSSGDFNVELNVVQLRLMHHYTTITASTLANSRDSEQVFVTTLVELAFNHAYLLHATLAITALHLSHLQDPGSPQKRDYRILAEKHHEAGLNAFQAMVKDIDRSNFKAVLLFTNVLFPYSCVTSITARDNIDHAFESVLANLVLTRRTRPMVTSFYEEMKESELGRIIPADVRDVNWPEAETPPTTELTQLRKFATLIHHVYPADITDAYGHAIHFLDLTFDVASRSPAPPSDALLKIWIHFVSDRYMHLLTDRQPGSLIIFAHFAVLVHRCRHYWFLSGLGRQILALAEALVPAEWTAWLDWPRAQVFGPGEAVVTAGLGSGAST